ncbi:uncharacterized protein LOC143911733 isoform X1 [Arctopsyche grandis]|uniref:uncharacterized protein LOC143911733 isoform X1 n=1 Tax=Arctopsyche grandis TaxID=121162 RepID=UPI00406D9351
MECRLCLCSAPSESSVSIHDDPHPLVQRIWKCCQMPVEKGDNLPDTICLLCVKNLELFNTFRNVCIQSNETARLRLDECVQIKTEEVLLEDLTWKDETDVISSSNVCDSIVNNKTNDSEENREKFILCDNRTETIDDIEIPHSAQSGLDHQINIQNKSNDIESHSRINRHECNICFRSFALKRYLVAHMKYHTGAKPHKCNVCFKSFTKKYIFLRHERSHTGEKPYECDICFKSYSLKSHLVEHMKSHTGEKPHKCNICFKSFTRKNSLVEHIQSHTGDKPYKCDICFKSYSVKGSLLPY